MSSSCDTVYYDKVILKQRNCIQELFVGIKRYAVLKTEVLTSLAALAALDIRAKGVNTEFTKVNI